MQLLVFSMFAHMRLTLLAVVCCCVMLFSLSARPVSAAATDPTAQLRPFLTQVMATLDDPSFRKLPKKAQGDHMLKVVQERFDFHEMSKRVLGRYWRTMTPTQQQEFESLFMQLLEAAYVGKIDDYNVGETIQYGQQRIQGDRSEVQTNLVNGTKSIPISYIMHLQGDRWMIYDIVAEGVSLVRNYLEQFQQIISQNGYPSLAAQMRQKISQLQSQVKQ